VSNVESVSNPARAHAREFPIINHHKSQATQQDFGSRQKIITKLTRPPRPASGNRNINCNINVKRQSSMQQRLHFTHANKRARPHSRPATLRLFAADGGPRKALPGRGSHFLITVISKSKFLMQMPISHLDGR